MMHQSKNFFQVLPEMKKDILDFLSAERLTVYHRGLRCIAPASFDDQGHMTKKVPNI
jgi:hypothetical protein